MRVHATVPAVIFVSLSILIALGARSRAAAESACVEQPDRDAPEGEHWYYHFDSQKNRKCWHLGSAVTAAPHDAPSTLRPERPRSAPSPLNSVFAPIVRGVRNLFRQPAPREVHGGEPRIIQSDPTRPLTIDDIAQQPEFPEERAETRPVTGLTASQRKALYDEYLKWETLQRNSDGSLPAPPPAR